MTSPRRGISLLFIFIATFTLGLILTFFADYKISTTIADADASKWRVDRAYSLSSKLEKIDRAIEQLQTPPEHPQEYTNTYNLVLGLKESLIGDLEQESQVEKLLALLAKNDQRSFRAAADVASQMSVVQSKELGNAIQAQQMVSEDLQKSSQIAQTLDALLIIVLGVIFFLDWRNNRKIENNMLTTLNTLHRMNESLQTRESIQQIESRIVVHDLKNPLATILGFSNLLKDKGAESISIQQCSDVIRKNSERALKLIESILKDHPAELKKEKVEAVSEIKKMVQRFEIQAMIKHQTIKTEFPDIPVFISANLTKLVDLFSQLIDNALKYSPYNETVWIRCKKEDGLLKVRIEDKGPGFTEDDKVKAFKMGQVLSAKPTGDETATGYGLFVAKQIVDVHGGSIHIDRAPGGPGACLCVDLPTI